MKSNTKNSSQFILPKNKIDEFYEVGFIIIENVFTINEISNIIQALNRLESTALLLDQGMIMHNGSQFVIDKHSDGSTIQTKIKRVVWCGSAEPKLLKMGQDSRLMQMAGQIMGCNQANHIINQVHFKLPGDNVFFPFHQDSRHRGYGTNSWKDINGKGSYVQMVMAIDEVTLDNGPMLFVPHSCRNGHLDLPYDEEDETISQYFNAEDAVPALMNPGSVALFGPYTIHGSKPNKSYKPRRVFINGFAYPGANFRDYPGKGSGELIDIHTE